MGDYAPLHAWLIGQPATSRTFAEAAERATQELQPEEDLHASREYRLHLARTLTRRALASVLSAE